LGDFQSGRVFPHQRLDYIGVSHACGGGWIGGGGLHTYLWLVWWLLKLGEVSLFEKKREILRIEGNIRYESVLSYVHASIMWIVCVYRSHGMVIMT
jgi:hypothetical protein